MAEQPDQMTDSDAVTTLVEGTVVTMDAERRVIRDGAVAVAGERIAAVGSAAELRSQFPDAPLARGVMDYYFKDRTQQLSKND